MANMMINGLGKGEKIGNEMGGIHCIFSNSFRSYAPLELQKEIVFGTRIHDIKYLKFIYDMSQKRLSL